jgi:inosine/xanthosine triphosphatase
MRINIGSRNIIKVEAVKESVADYSFLSNLEFLVKDVCSEVSEQPKSLEETIRGAMNRDKNSFENCDYSFGLESGLFLVPYTKTSYMDLCACAIYDGKDYHLGLSSAFEFPEEVMKLILEKGQDASQACFNTGLTDNENIGSAEGIIGILTRGRTTRKDYTKQAITMAMVHLENKR